MQIDRTQKPKEKGNIEFSLPEIQRFELKNGLQTIFVEKNNLPIVQMLLNVNDGSKSDPQGKKGLAFLTSLLIDEGAGNLDALELDNEIESLGSILRCYNNQDNATISMLTLRENFERSLELFSMVITSPLFSAKDFEREKKKHLTKIIQLQDDPEFIANSAFRKILFRNTPYESPIIGYYPEVENINLTDVKEFYQKIFTVNNSTLIVVGNISKDELKNKLDGILGEWNNKGEYKIKLPGFQKPGKKLYFIHKEGSAQSELRIGTISGERKAPDYYAKTLMNSILGGQFSSRINLNLREDKGFTYGAHSNFNYNQKGSSFTVSTGVESEHTAESVAEIFKEFEGMKKSVSAAELAFSKSYLIKRYPSMFETYSQIAGNLSMLPQFGLPDDYFNKYIENLEKVNLEEVITAAKNTLNEDEIITIIVGDNKIIDSQFKNYDGKIIELDTGDVLSPEPI